MKYFTKEWYDELQVSGFLTFPETEEEWEAYMEGYRADGVDPSDIQRQELEDIREDLLKFLPESFHPYIYDGSINAAYPSSELQEMILKWEADHEARVDTLLDGYSRHYESIKELLPEGAVQLTEKSLHDCVVTSVEHTADDRLVLRLDCQSGFHYFKEIQVTFTGVVEALISENLVGAVWLYNEIYLLDNLLELHVLFNMPITEVTIVSRNVQIEELE